MSRKREPLSSPLRRRRLLSVVGWMCVALLVMLAALDRAGAFGVRDEAARLDRAQVVVTDAIDGGTIRVKSPSGDVVTVGLLGVDAPRPPAEHWAQRALDYTKARLVGRTVTLRVEPTQSRDERGRVLAYVYVTDADLMNADIIRDGQAYAARRVRHPLAKQFEQLETEPRKKLRGLWKDVTDEQMPAWRREWLKRWREEHSE